MRNPNKIFVQQLKIIQALSQVDLYLQFTLLEIKQTRQGDSGTAVGLFFQWNTLYCFNILKAPDKLHA